MTMRCVIRDNTTESRLSGRLHTRAAFVLGLTLVNDGAFGPKLLSR